MEREIIESTVASLPFSRIGEIQSDHEIWEEYDGGAKFMVTRHILPTPNKDEIISLSVSGKPSERRRVIDEFLDVFGDPYEPVVYVQDVDAVKFVIWLAQKA